MLMPMTCRGVEILLDSADRRDYVLSAYADLTVQDGFRHYADRFLREEVRSASAALGSSEARKALDDNIPAVLDAIRDQGPGTHKGLAVFVSQARGLNHVVSLEFPVENRIILDEDPFVLPLLERWYGDPIYLIAEVDSGRVALSESHSGNVEPVRTVDRPADVYEGDKEGDTASRQSSKKKFAHGFHERLHGAEEDRFFLEIAETIAVHWAGGRFAGLILLGQPPITGPLRKLLPRDVQSAIVERAAVAGNARADRASAEGEVAKVMSRWYADRERELLSELVQRLEGAPPRRRRTDRGTGRPPARAGLADRRRPGPGPARLAVPRLPLPLRRPAGEVPLLRRRVQDEQCRAGNPPHGAAPPRSGPPPPAQRRPRPDHPGRLGSCRCRRQLGTDAKTAEATMGH